MEATKEIGKREFIQHTSKYLKWVESNDDPLIITHQNVPRLLIKRISSKSIHDLRGLITSIKVEGDINAPILPGYDEWFS